MLCFGIRSLLEITMVAKCFVLCFNDPNQHWISRIWVFRHCVNKSFHEVNWFQRLRKTILILIKSFSWHVGVRYTFRSIRRMIPVLVIFIIFTVKITLFPIHLFRRFLNNNINPGKMRKKYRKNDYFQQIQLVKKLKIVPFHFHMPRVVNKKLNQYPNFREV